MDTKWEVKFAQGGLREAKAMFRNIAASIDPAESNLSAIWKIAQDEVQDGFRRAAITVRDKARGNAQSAGVPRRLYSGPKPAIFAFSDFKAGQDDKRKRSSLVGVRTGLASRAYDERLFIRWGFGSKRKKDGSTATGGLSMSLGALFERGRKGGGRIKAARYFRGAVFGTRAQVAQMLTQAYHKAAALLNSTKTNA